MRVSTHMDLSQLSFIIAVPLSTCSMLPLCLSGLPGSMAFMQMSADELERYHKNHPKVMQVRPSASCVIRCCGVVPEALSCYALNAVVVCEGGRSGRMHRVGTMYQAAPGRRKAVTATHTNTA